MRYRKNKPRRLLRGSTGFDVRMYGLLLRIAYHQRCPGSLVERIMQAAQDGELIPIAIQRKDKPKEEPN